MQCLSCPIKPSSPREIEITPLSSNFNFCLKETVMMVPDIRYYVQLWSCESFVNPKRAKLSVGYFCFGGN